MAGPQEEVEAGVIFQEHDMMMEGTAESAAPKPKSVGRPKNRGEDAIGKRKAKIDIPTKSTRAKKKRTELQMLRGGGFGTQMDDSDVVIVGDEENEFVGGNGGNVEDSSPVLTPLSAPIVATAAESTFVYPPPITTKKSRTKPLLPPAELPDTTNKNKRISKSRVTASLTATTARAGSTKPSRSLKFSAKPAPKKGISGDKNGKKGEQGGINYEILPHIPGTTETIFDRYPTLHKLASAKRGKKGALTGVNRDASKGLDINRLIFLCRKASSIGGRNNTMKAGAENSVISGSKEPIFLRRNVARVQTRVGTGV